MSINEQLLHHFQHGSGAAKYLRNRIWGVLEQVERLFQVRSDLKRIAEAEKVAWSILEMMEYQEIAQLRRTLATIEAKETVVTEKKTDHATRTVYMFLLGVFLYDNVPEIKAQIDHTIESNKKEKMFLFRWTFASLLRDVGYLYDGQHYDSHGHAYDDLFKRAFALEYTHFDDVKQKDAFVKEIEWVWSEFKEKYMQKETTAAKTPQDLLDSLSQVLWMKEVLDGLSPSDIAEHKKEYVERLRQKDALNAYAILEGDQLPALEEYAKKVESEGKVDPSLAGGLMLFQYTSIWYWLSLRVRRAGDLNQELHAYYEYPLKVLLNDVIPACRAVAYQNISVPVALKTDPFLYLGILCEELQVWDRSMLPPAHECEWERVEQHCMGENVTVEVDAEGYVFVSFEHHEVRKKVKNKLEKRLENLNQYVKI